MSLGFISIFSANLELRAANPVVAAETHTYTIYSDGMPADAVVVIHGQEFRNLNAQDGQTLVSETLSESDVKVKVGGGYLGKVSVDNANYQINIDFIQFFIPTTSVTDEKQFPYLMKMPLAYVKRTSGNLSHTTDRKEADKFLFIEKEQGQYYIYDMSAKMYIYYTNTKNGSSVTSTSSSYVKATSNATTAKTWQLLLLSDETVAIIPGSISEPTQESPAWNFTGGIANNCVLNLWTASDSNSAWDIIDPAAGSLSCATLLYSKPGAPFLHKLVVNEGETVSDVDFGSISTLSLKNDRLNVGNKYKYVSGTAPELEGEYSYTVLVNDAEGEQKQVKVRLIVSDFLQSPTPMMAWLTWNWFARSISHAKMVAIAKGMEKHGLIDAGFNTIVLDDAWAAPTTDKSMLTYDSSKFPQGISGLKKALQGVNPKLKVGIYSDAGSMTCENYQPGSYGYESQHIGLFNGWGVDMLKYDYCNHEASTKISYGRMGEVIEKLNVQRKSAGNNPFTFNICEWGKTQPWLWGAEAGGSSWRSTSDVREDWVGDSSRPGVLAATDETRRLWMYAGVNRFNDLDMMCIGLHGLGGPSNNTMNHMQNGGTITGLTPAQARSQMSLWCMFASPLSLTCDFRQSPKGEANSGVTLPNPLITDDDVATLTNAEIIAINQDALGQQAEYMEALSTGTTDYSNKGYDVYVKDLVDGSFAIAIVNRAKTAQASITLSLHDLYMQSGCTYLCHDVWDKFDFDVTDSLETGKIAACETKVYVLKPKGDADHINEVNVDTSEVPAYDLLGRRTNNLKTIHIKNGKKRTRE